MRRSNDRATRSKSLQEEPTPVALVGLAGEISNDLWQIDATQVRLVTKKKTWVLDMIDDHSRCLLSALASPAPTVDAAWDCFEEAASRYGLPRQVLSDRVVIAWR